MQNLLIVGDSFCSPNRELHSWHNQLKNDYNVTNLGQNGVSQYKIHQQLLRACVNSYDIVLILLTSPYRIYVETNPFYVNHPTHSSADLLYTDVLHKEPSVTRDNVVWWFENIFDTQAAQFQQIATVCWDIEFLKQHKKSFRIVSFFEPLKTNFNVEWLHSTWLSHPGNVNHLSQQGHDKVYERLKRIL